MPRYFFNLHDGEYMPDLKGVELSGPDEAALEAKRLGAVVARFFPSKLVTVVVTDELKNVVAEHRVDGRSRD